MENPQFVELPYEDRFSRDKLFEFIIFLSFNKVWKIFIVMNVAAMYVYFTYGIFVETPEFLIEDRLISLVFDIPYFIDIVTALIHSKFTSWSCRRIHKPKNAVYTFLDIITLIPYYFILRPSKENWTFRGYLVFGIPCLRIYRIILYSIEISSLIGFNSWTNALQKFLVIVIVSLHTMSCLWYKFGCLHSVKQMLENKTCPLNWAMSVHEKFISPDTNPAWYFIAFYYVNAIVSTVGFGDIMCTNDKERWLTVFFMITGWLMMGVFLGNCTSIQVQNFHHYASFFRRFNLIKVELEQQKIDRETQNKMMNFYSTFWKHRSGIRSSELHMALPLPMRLEVDVDTYFHALDRSHMFHQLSNASKQALAKVMGTELYMPGEIVQYRGAAKTSMFYISSGTLNILSATDDETPIISLTSGTLLGEANLVLRSPSIVQIEAATYTEVQFLEQRKMLSLVTNYPEISQQAKYVFEAKVRDAKSNTERKQIYSLLRDSRVLQILKKAIRRRNKEQITLASPIWFLDEELEDNMIYSPEDEIEGYTYIDDNLNLYHMPMGTEADKIDNDVCVRTRCPWVFNPSNDFLFIWDCAVFVFVLIICIIFPYYIGFKAGIPPDAISFVWGVFIIYVLDIYFQLTTALDIGGVIETNLKVIISKKITSPYFVMDVLSTVPVEMFILAVEIDADPRLINILRLNRVLKSYKILKFFKRLEGNIKINLGTMRMFKSMLCLTIGAFWMGTIFYMLACDYERCKHESWMACIIVQDCFDLVLQLEVTRHHYTALLSFYGALQMIAGVGLGDVVPRTYLEISVVIFFLILGTLLIVYLIADYSAMLILESKNRMQFKELVLMMQKFLENNNMPIPFQRRVYDYLALQWTYRDGFYMLNDKPVYFDAPERICNAVEIARRAHILSNIPIFKDGKQECIHELSIMAKSHILPPNEMVIYGGDMCHEFYILEEGYCEEIAGATGDILRILSPPMEFCTTEVLFGICVVNSVRTVTHCKLSRLTYNQIFRVLLHYPDLERDINRTTRDIRNANLLSTLTEAEAVLTITQEQKQDESSWYTYHASSKKYKNIDYLGPFMDLHFFHFVRFVLLNRTMLPYGKFLKWWEGFRSVLAFVSSMLFPPITHLSVAGPWLLYVCPILDILAVIDMYMRLHIGYYNENGILVSHPWWTAKHYVKNDFLFDLLGCVPINYFFLNVVLTPVHTTTFQWKDNIFKYVVHMNRVIQARRIPTIIAHLETSLLAHTQLLKFLKYVPISVVLANTLASLLVGISVAFYQDNPPNINPNSWLSALAIKTKGYVLDSPFHVHIYALIWMAGCATSVGTSIITAQSGIEMLFTIMSIASGYLLYTFVTVKISSSKVNDNINLTSYQERMRHLIRFLNTEGHVTKELKHQIIDHFEHIWQRTRGVQASKIISKFYNALKRDAALYLFEETLMKVSTFAGLGRSFYQRLGMIVLEDYYIKGAYILKQNDVVSNIYIVHKGEVIVVAGDGTQMEVLERGSMFGNIFNFSTFRSLQTFIASKHVDVLVTSTGKFYNLVQDFPIVKARFEKSYENYTGYLKQYKVEGLVEELQSLLKKTTVAHKAKKRNYLETVIAGTTVHRYATVALLFCSFLSYIFITYQAAFQDHRNFYLCVTYILEAIYLLKVCMGFYLPYQDESGEIITNKILIGKRYIRTPTGFWLDLISALPMDVMILICFQRKKRWEWASYVRCCQMIRIVYIFRYFNLKYERLNVNMILQKMSSTVTYFALFTHSAACIWYLIGKYDKYESTWVYQNNTLRATGYVFQYHSPYCISFYFICALMSTVGPVDVQFTTISELIFTLIIIFFSKPITALFIGEMSATIASSTYTLVNKDYDTTILKIYMKNDQVSYPLIKKVIQYVKMLWVLGRGMQVPDFLTTAPRYLSEEFKVTAYGMHVHEAVIFKGCDNDLLRQLITYFKRFTFFPGNFIAYEGEVNNRMYFIHQGVVEVVTTEGSIEYLHDVLYERDIFGVTQGLRNGIPHKYTFKAITVVIILALKLTDWEHLCEFFPSSKQQIYGKLEALNF